MHCRARAVHGDLHALHAEPRQAIGRSVVDARAVGFDLECNAARREQLEQIPEMRRTERLAAAECYIGNPGCDDALCEVERLGAIQLIAPGPVGPRLLATGEAARRAAVGQLPGKKKGRAVLADGTPRQFELLCRLRQVKQLR